jgi:ADP-ribose diphosphatase
MKTDNPGMPRRTRPRRLQHRVLYNGRVFRAELDRVELPNGRTAAFEIVRHRGSVVLVPQPTPNQIVLVRQFRYVVNRWLWELPAGSREPGEPFARCARRECEEEIRLRPGRVKRLAALYPSPGFCDELMVFYHCTDLRTPRRLLPRDIDEQLEPRVFTTAEARAMVQRGAIIDMKTVVGLGLVES